jgi:solute carrier family 25 iron transporter 28/37
MKTFLNPTGEYSPSTHVMAGGVAGATAAAVTTPLDVAKVSINASGSRPR